MPRTKSARVNSSTRASVNLNTIVAEGSFRYVFKGKYTEGERNGEACACKIFKDRNVMENSYFASDLKVVEKSLCILDQWNDAEIIVDKKIYLNEPTVWEFTSGQREGQKNLTEPWIENWEKFNSNTGWTSHQMPWHLVMQALSHFSYHTTGGSILLCDVQGGVYANGCILTDPAIMSQTQEYGPTDLGSKGISSFFNRHSCNRYCRKEWIMPRDRTPYYAAVQGSSMIQNGAAAPYVPTRPSRPPLTHQTIAE